MLVGTNIILYSIYVYIYACINYVSICAYIYMINVIFICNINVAHILFYQGRNSNKFNIKRLIHIWLQKYLCNIYNVLKILSSSPAQIII